MYVVKHNNYCSVKIRCFEMHDINEILYDCAGVIRSTLPEE